MKYLFLPCCLLVFITSCQPKPNLEAEKKAIIAIHNTQQRAHLEKNVQLLWPDSLVDYIEVNRGQVKQPSQAENLSKFKAYFNAVDFLAWEDSSPPIISFSDDASMATSVVSKRVITKSKTAPFNIDTTQFAWLAVFKKVKGQWQLHRMGSTNK